MDQDLIKLCTEIQKLFHLTGEATLSIPRMDIKISQTPDGKTILAHNANQPGSKPKQARSLGQAVLMVLAQSDLMAQERRWNRDRL